MALFTHKVKKMKNAVHKNGDVNGTCKRPLMSTKKIYKKKKRNGHLQRIYYCIIKDLKGDIMIIRTYIDSREGCNFRPGSNEDVFGFNRLDGPVLLRDVHLVRVRYTPVTVRSPHLRRETRKGNGKELLNPRFIQWKGRGRQGCVPTPEGPNSSILMQFSGKIL